MIPMIIYILSSVLLGAVSCLFGKKLYFPILMLTVFGAVVTISLSIFDWNSGVGIVTFIAAIIAALLSRFFYKLGVFFIGGILGGGISLMLVSFLPSAADKFGWLIVLLFMIAAGICAVKWCDFFIMASTSFTGAFTIAVSLCFLFKEFHHLQNFIYADGMMPTITNLNHYLNNQFSAENGMLIFLLSIIIALGGFYFQIRTNRKNQ